MWIQCRLGVLVRFTRWDGRIHCGTLVDLWYAHGHLSYVIVKDAYDEVMGDAWGAQYYTMVEPRHIVGGQ